MKLSVRMKLFIAMSGLIVFFAITSWALNSQLLNKYYIYKKEKFLIETYDKLNSQYKSDTSAVSLEVEKLERLQGMYIALYNSNYFCIYESMQGKNDFPEKKDFPGKRDIPKQIFGAFAAPEYHSVEEYLRKNTELLDAKKSIILNFNSKRLKTGFLTIVAKMNNGDYLLAAVPVAPINENVAIANDFYLFTGIFTILIGGIGVLLLSKKLTKPILEVNELSKKMANLDFTSRYEGKVKDEIGQLGQNINYMADKLEQTINELKLANEKLQLDIEMERRIDSMRKEFISNVSHELKTPIALIQGYSEGLKLNVNDRAEDKDFYCDVIMDETAKMNRLVRELLELSQIEYGNVELDKINFNITELIESVLKKNKLILEERGVKLDLDLLGEHNVYADYDRVEQVFINFFNNAINHLDEKKIIEVRIVEVEEYVRVYVYNSGENIPEDSLEKIWTSFYKVDKARTRAYGGTGLGLSIVRAIQELHNCNYGVENLSSGVEFWFDVSKNDSEL